MNTKVYSFREVEQKWNNIYQNNINGDDLYILPMFMYPSGKMHMGHCRSFTISDVITRYNIIKKYKVSTYAGWDAFGLPAENAAIKHKIHPREWTNKNIEDMKKSLQSINCLYNWENELRTCDNQYISHQQELFIKLYQAGLVYKKDGEVNWDPVDQTVLANEQVINGKGWRSGATVVKKRISQWYFKITQYADELLEELDNLNWPEKVKNAQRQWIGRQYGYFIEFQMTNGENFKAYTTRPETIYGCTFIAVAESSDLAYKYYKDNIKIGEAINLYTQNKIPIYIADYVIADHGTGIVMGVPAHDLRDQLFAQKYDIPIIEVINEDKALFNNEWIKIEEIRGRFKQEPCYKMRDWLISRQRYWGCPIPMIYCDNCQYVPSKVLLPNDVEFGYGNPLDNEKWKKVKCPQCNSDAQRETDTMDTFVDSSWYFLRFPFANYDKPFDIDNAKPVDIYIGGDEHAVLHLLYSRFITKALRDLNLLKFSEPFTKLINQGMICAPTYQGKNTLNYYAENECIAIDNKLFNLDKTEEIIQGSYAKMSKSLSNGISPAEIIESFGNDALRLFIISDSPINQVFYWNTNGLFGCRKFLNKIWSLSCNLSNQYKEDNNKYIESVHQFLYDINIHIQNEELNIFVADLRRFVDFIKTNTASEQQVNFAFRYLLKSLWIICPSLANELYTIHNYNNDIISDWISDILISKKSQIVVSINGKKKTIVEYFNLEEICKSINIPVNTKYVYVKNKIINFIISS